jgi:copper/silver efflux system protein
MINRLIEFSLKNRGLILLAYALLAVWGYWALVRTPIDAIPDLSENQVIVYTDWAGRSPQEVEDQITYPLTVNLQGLAGVRDVRSSSALGFSMINIIFQDNIDPYFARTRVLERLNLASGFLPEGVVPVLGPDATGWARSSGTQWKDLTTVEPFIRCKIGLSSTS